ncbi:hypothetical protein BGW80DRAFT_1473742 [Lactifluus volemus]|nr:hypothetical protein BGW80DRAFT_1473742 [Lactifluus volemus]
MSFTNVALYPANPTTTRGESTRLGASKGKIVYTNGKTVFNPALGVSYNGHTQNTTVARVSPTGFYCASADTSGTVRIWDIVGDDQALKGEFKVISGKINDLEWDGKVNGSSPSAMGKTNLVTHSCSIRVRPVERSSDTQRSLTPSRSDINGHSALRQLATII